MKRTLLTAIAMFALVGLVRADELEDSYTKLKETVAKKDAEAVKADARHQQTGAGLDQSAAAVRCRGGPELEGASRIR